MKKKGGFIQAVAGPLIEKASNQVDDLIGTIFGSGIKKRKGGKYKGHIETKFKGITYKKGRDIPKKIKAEIANLGPSEKKRKGGKYKRKTPKFKLGGKASKKYLGGTIVQSGPLP